jgi:hypothetical protein
VLFRASKTTGPDPACHRDAGLILTQLQIPFRQVVRVDSDSILYLTPTKEPRTLWLHRDPISQALSHKVEQGFSIEPPLWPCSPTSPSSAAPSPPQP